MGGLAIGDEEGMARSLWTKSTNESIFAIYTPYILSLASGKLDSGSFLHCISQDLLFLQASAEAFEMAEECSDDDDDKTVIRKIRKRVLKKMSMFQSIVQEWGFELPTGNISDRAMVKYTDFLLATASGKAVGERFPGKLTTPFEKTKLSAYALAAMAPSMRLQSFLSKEIQAVLEPDENMHLYKKWIDSLASQKYEASASQIEELLDKLTVSLTGEELQFVETIYHKAMKLQVDFYSAQPINQKTIIPLYRALGSEEQYLVICSGFDMTCSAVDSCALLADIAIIKSSKSANSNGHESLPNDTLLHNLRAIWSSLHGQYVQEYEQCIDSIMLNEKFMEFDFESLCKALDRRFSRWKGSVVDSVIGVFLTQDVFDRLSSSAFMSLAAKFPIKICCKEPIEVAETKDILKCQENSSESSNKAVDDFSLSSESNLEAENVIAGFETSKEATKVEKSKNDSQNIEENPVNVEEE